MKIKEAILKSLFDFRHLANSQEIYLHIVENNYCDFENALTPERSIASTLGEFIRKGDKRVKRIKEDGRTYFYYLSLYEQEIFNQKENGIKDFLESEKVETNLIPQIMKITKPAVRVKQGDLTIYATTFKVRDLLIPNFFLVDKLDASSESSGFQRVLDNTRKKRLADYILKAWADNDAFLPTSIFLATNKDVYFDELKNEITIDIENVCPFNVVDGQHRVRGLIEAAEKNPEIEEFEIIANIAVNLDDITQMCHFLIVNTTQKSVNKAVEQQIIARLSGMVNIEDIPTLPKWIQQQVDKGEDKGALVITNYLNNEIDSPWYQKIKMANNPKNENTINQESFVQLIKTYILNVNNPIYGDSNIEKRNKILKNYWKAINELLINKDSKKESVIFKTLGLELFCIISITVFTKLYTEKNFTVGRIIEILSNGFNNLSNEHLNIQNPEWWESGGEGASGVNKAGIRQIATDLSRAINVQESNGNFAI